MLDLSVTDAPTDTAVDVAALVPVVVISNNSRAVMAASQCCFWNCNSRVVDNCQVVFNGPTSALFNLLVSLFTYNFRSWQDSTSYLRSRRQGC